MSVVALDLETYLIAPSLVAPPIVVGSYAYQDGRKGLIPGLEVGQFVRKALAEGHHLVGQNIAFDVFCIIQEWPELREDLIAAYDQGRIHDVMLREQLLDIRAGTFKFEEYEDETGETARRPIGYSLGEIAKRHLGMVLNKSEDSWRLRYNELHAVPLRDWPHEALKYAADDAVATLGCFEHQERIGGEYLAKTEGDQVRAAMAFQALGSRGMCVNLEELERLETRLRETRDTIYPELVEAGIYRGAGTRDMKRLKALVADAYSREGTEVPMTKGTAKSAPEVKTSMAVLRDSGDLLLGRLAEFAKYEKMLTTFLPAMRVGANMPLTCSYNTLVETGRSSCRGVKWGKQRGPQFQNFPRMPGVRECFDARPGYYYCSVDYSQLELCTLAQVVYDMGCGSNLRDAINKGLDLHMLFACGMNGWNYEDVISLKKQKPYKDGRQSGKAANFGFPGGLGALKFVGYAKDQYNVVMSVPEARAAQQAWRDAWPDGYEYQRQTGDALESTGEGVVGVSIDRTGFERGRCRYTQACNTPFQGLAAAGAKRALWALFKKTGLGLFPVTFVHDEVISEVPIEGAHEVSHLKTEIMIEEMQKLCPDVKISAEPALMRSWFKEAETVYDSNGRLAPWAPKQAA